MPTLAVLLLSLAVTLVAWHNAWQNQQLRDQARLNRFVGRTEQSLRNRLGRYEDIARGAQGFFVGGQSPLAVEQWRTYVAGLDLPGRHPGLTSLAFIAPVPLSGPSSLAATTGPSRIPCPCMPPASTGTT